MGFVIKWFSHQQAPNLVRESSSKCKVETNCENPQYQHLTPPEWACTHQNVHAHIFAFSHISDKDLPLTVTSKTEFINTPKRTFLICPFIQLFNKYTYTAYLKGWLKIHKWN